MVMAIKWFGKSPGVCAACKTTNNNNNNTDTVCVENGLLFKPIKDWIISCFNWAKKNHTCDNIDKILFTMQQHESGEGGKIMKPLKYDG